MSVIRILTTCPSGLTSGDFRDDHRHFVFGQLGLHQPTAPGDAPTWAFIDWVTPNMSGLEMCRRLKADGRTRGIHVTLVLDRDEVEDRRRALSAGADDYMLGPLTAELLRERILALAGDRKLLRSPRVIDAGEFAVDLEAHLVRYRGQPVQIRRRQFRLLRHFLENPNRVHTREELVEALSHYGPPVSHRTVDKWIARLREALQAVNAGHLLRTVHAEGYVLDIP